MAKFLITTNINQFVRKVDEHGKRYERNIKRGVNACLVMFEAEAKFLIMNGYYRPAFKTGTLKNSITHKLLFVSNTIVEGAIGTHNVYYAKYVHDGTYKMEKRPFLRDAILNKKETALKILREAVNKV